MSVADFKQSAESWFNSHGADGVPRNTWRVRMQVREHGAQGEFTEVDWYVRGEAPYVTEYALEDARIFNLEPGWILKKEKIR